MNIPASELKQALQGLPDTDKAQAREVLSKAFGSERYAQIMNAEPEEANLMAEVFGSDTRAPKKRSEFSRSQKAQFFAAARQAGLSPVEEWYKLPG